MHHFDHMHHQSSVKSMLSCLLNGSCFFTTLIVLATTPTISTRNPFLYFSQFSPPYFTSLLVHKTVSTIPTITLLSSIPLCLPIFTYSHSCHPHQKSFPLARLFSQFRLRQELNEQLRFWWTDNLNLSLFPWAMDRDNNFHYHWFLIARAQKISLLQVKTCD